MVVEGWHLCPTFSAPVHSFLLYTRMSRHVKAPLWPQGDSERTKSQHRGGHSWKVQRAWATDNCRAHFKPRIAFFQTLLGEKISIFITNDIIQWVFCYLQPNVSYTIEPLCFRQRAYQQRRPHWEVKELGWIFHEQIQDKYLGALRSMAKFLDR